MALDYAQILQPGKGVGRHYSPFRLLLKGRFVENQAVTLGKPLDHGPIREVGLKDELLMGFAFDDLPSRFEECPHRSGNFPRHREAAWLWRRQLRRWHARGFRGRALARLSLRTTFP